MPHDYTSVRLNWSLLDPASHDAPRVDRICQLTGLDRHAIVGRLAKWFSWKQAHHFDKLTAENPKTDPRGGSDSGEEVTAAFVDEWVECPGFAAALVDIGWLEHTPEGFLLPNARARQYYAGIVAAQTARSLKAPKAPPPPPLSDEEKAERARLKEARRAEKRAAYEAIHGPGTAKTSGPRRQAMASQAAPKAPTTLAGIRKQRAEATNPAAE